MEKSDSQPAVLIVDDEEIVTTSLRNLFRLRTSYRPVGCTSPEEALVKAKTETFDLVITDYLMPGMDGIAFLARFKEVQPQAMRILLTGYADKESAIRAINQVGLYQYVEKPWDNESLLMIAKNALEKGALLRTLDLKIGELQAARASLKDFQNELIRTFI
jgi:DNA-binding NtrC family response regulator